MTADGLCANEFVPCGRLAQSIAFLRLLKAAGDASVVLGGYEQHRIHCGDRILSARPAGG
jgi:hypothetical protein